MAAEGLHFFMCGAPLIHVWRAADSCCAPLMQELFQRVATGDCTGVSQLLDAGVSVMCTGGMATEDTPLHWAAAFGNIDVIELLVARGADGVNMRGEAAS